VDQTMPFKKKKQKTEKKSSKSAVPTDDGWKQLDIQKAFARQAKPQNLLAIFPSDFLKDTISSFLSINDITNLSLTSHEMFKKISSTREYPCLVWEERLPTRMRYEGRNDDDRTTLFQVHPFVFLLRTESEEVLRVDVSLQNEAWDEETNMRDGDNCRGLDQFPSRTEFFINIDKIESSKREQVFRIAFWVALGELENWWISLASMKEVWEDWDNLSPSQEEEMRAGMIYTLMCLKCVSDYPDGTAYPSAEYLMRDLPEWTHPYFPSDFDWEKECTDRKTKIEFSYRPARTLVEWRGATPPHEDVEYKLDELPWYRKGYSWFSDDDCSSNEDEN